MLLRIPKNKGNADYRFTVPGFIFNPRSETAPTKLLQDKPMRVSRYNRSWTADLVSILVKDVDRRVAQGKTKKVAVSEMVDIWGISTQRINNVYYKGKKGLMPKTQTKKVTVSQSRESVKTEKYRVVPATEQSDFSQLVSLLKSIGGTITITL